MFVKCEMEEGKGTKVSIFRRIFGRGSTTSSVSDDEQSTFSLDSLPPPRERRPLRSVPSNGPQFKVDPEVLVKEYVEKEIKHMGTVSDIKHDFDSANRWMVLSLLDEKRKLGVLPTQLSWWHDIIIRFSVHHIKLFCREGEEEVHRIPTHQISSTGYLQDDNQIVLFIKFASELDNDVTNLALFSCDSKMAAQEICCLTHQILQLAYSNSTGDISTQDGALTSFSNAHSKDDPVGKGDTIQQSFPLTQYNHGRNTIRTGNDSGVFRHVTSVPVESRSWQSQNKNGSPSPNSSHPHQLQEFIEVLKGTLTNEELALFAHSLHHFRTGTVPVKTFCEQLMEIYTEERKFLMLGMRHFIPIARDRSYFESFLERMNISESVDTNWSHRRHDSRTMSDIEAGSESPVDADDFPNEELTVAGAAQRDDVPPRGLHPC